MKYSAWFKGMVFQPSTSGSPQSSLRSTSVSFTVSPVKTTVGHGARSLADAGRAQASRTAAAAVSLVFRVNAAPLAFLVRDEPQEQGDGRQDQHQADGAGEDEEHDDVVDQGHVPTMIREGRRAAP